MKWVLRLGLVVLILLLAAGGFWFYRSRAASTASTATSGNFTQVVDVQRGNLSAAITVVGELDAAQRADLTFERMTDTTKLVSLDVKPGNTVKVGQVLATIDPASYQQALDQANSDLQTAEQTLADLKTPATALAIATADETIAQANHGLQQAKQDLINLQTPDLSTLEAAVQNAQDNLPLAKLQQTLAQHDAMAKSERDLQYAAGWHQRRIVQLQDLVRAHKANLEQTQQITTEQETLGEIQSDLARIQAQRQLSLQSAAASITNAQATLVEAQKALADGKAGGDKLALAQAQLAVKDAEYTLAAAKDARAKLDEGTDAVTLASAQADVDKKRLAVFDAQAALAGTKLTAPFDGTVLQTNAAVGDVVAANTPILTVANLSDLQVLASVDETTIRQVSAGQLAQITFDAVPGQTLQGQVGEVPLQGTLQGGVMVYEVPISLVGAEKLPLLVGMTANVKIAVGQAENALLVPAMALQKANGMYQVLVPNTTDPAGQPEAVPVEVGLSDGSYTQIVRGLNDGDKIVVEMAAAQSNTNFRGFGEIGGGPPPDAQRRPAAGGN
jgi:RND family efflux transporter MFP subunit